MSIRILHDYIFDEATISSSSEEGLLVDDNVVDQFIAKTWRATGDTDEWIKFTSGAAMAPTMVGIFGHNFSATATVTLQANATDAWGSPSYEQAFTWDEGSMIIFPAGSPSYQWWRIHIADASNPDGYVAIGRVCAGIYVEPSIGVNAQAQKSWQDPSTSDSSYGQQKYSIVRLKYRIFSLTLEDMGRADQDIIIDMYKDNGNIFPVVIALDPNNYPNKDTIYSLIATPIDMALRVLNQGTIALTFQELVS